ncbi:MAG: cysteine--tRNA ligase [Planctomycetota bacterium]|nr:cysteine--tRNA ligase [Planctomycetota bacterium]
MLQLYNTQSKRKETFEPLRPGIVRMYNCGPTVYSDPHIGNFRAFIFADLLRRYLEYKGLTVTQVMNLTDVGHILEDQDEGEDRMETAAKRENKDPWEIARRYANVFLTLVDRLGLRRASNYPRATDHIPEMIAMIERLIARGFAYVVNNAVYYDISKFPAYGKLSGNTPEQLIAGSRVEVNPDKRNPLDFALWKHDPRHVMQWDSPWGRGFPGWHIECSAMATKYLGDTLDIHTGGEDNIFPHHESEIAQSEGATSKPFVRYWLHARHLLVNGEKMSKSKGNFYTVNDVLAKGYSAAALRYALMAPHYRQAMNFSMEALDAARNAVQRLQDFKRSMTSASEAARSGADSTAPDASAATTCDELIENTRVRFESALDDDLNISEALAALFDFVRDANRTAPTGEPAWRMCRFLEKIDSVLNVMSPDSSELTTEEAELIAKREAARRAKDFKTSDAVRAELAKRGIIVEDTAAGTRWKRS